MAEKAKKPRVMDTIPDADIVLKEDRIEYYEIEATDFMFDAATDEEQKSISDKNEKFEKNVLVPRMLRTIRDASCFCPEQGRRLYRRWARKTANPRLSIDKPLSQADLDSYNWGVIALADHGVDQEILLLVRECRKCGRLDHFTGHAPSSPMLDRLNKLVGCEPPQSSLAAAMTPLMLQYGRIYMNYIDTNNNNVVVENLETGEIEPAGDLLRMIQGLGPGGQE